MKIAVLSRNSELYSTRRLVEAAEERGHQIEVIDPLMCYMNINKTKSGIHYKGEVLEQFDAVIPRVGASITFYGTAVLRQFEMMGVYALNESSAISRARDKLCSLQLLAREGIGLPITGFADKPGDIPDLIDMVGGAPLVIKLLEGHQIEVIDPLMCYMNINKTKSGIHYKGEVLEQFDAVIPRVGASITFYGTAVLRQFEMMGVYALNESSAISRARDKLCSLQLLAREGIGLPITGFADKPGDIPDLIDMVGGAPLVIKLLEGTQGIGVVLAETRTAAESVIEAFMGLNANILVQEYIKEANGADIRCFVIGNKIVAAMKRQAKAGEFRSNLHRGGTASIVKLSADEKRTALAAAKTMGLHVAGVDILRSNHGPVVMEVNSSPGLEGIEGATDIDVAGRMIEYLEKHVPLHQARMQQKALQKQQGKK